MKFVMLLSTIIKKKSSLFFFLTPHNTQSSTFGPHEPMWIQGKHAKPHTDSDMNSGYCMYEAMENTHIPLGPKCKRISRKFINLSFLLTV